MPITAIAKNTLCRSRGGIVTRLFMAPCDEVNTLTFGTDDEITAITMVSTNTFSEINIAKETGSLTQELDENGNVTQSLQFFYDRQTAAVRKALRELADECCVHVIVQDNNQTFHYLGISHNPTTDEVVDEDMSVNTGTANTGAATTDNNEFSITMTCSSDWFAPHWSLGTAGIPQA